MTATQPDVRSTTTPTGPPDAARALQRLVQIDAAVAAVSSVVLLGAAADLRDLAGLSSSTPARAVGVFLLVLAVDLLWLGTSSDRNRQRWVPVSAAADVAWAVASVAVAALADLTGPGRGLIAAQGLAVLAMGEAKLLLHRRAR